jgi:hypothetical protein
MTTEHQPTEAKTAQPQALSVAPCSADSSDPLAICVARDMIAKLKADNAHLSERFAWWMKNAEAIAKERAELFRAGEAMRAAYVASIGTEKSARVEQWDEAAQPMRNMVKWISSGDAGLS